MPRRKLTGPVKTPADIRRLFAEYRSPAARRLERLQQFQNDLIRLRREGAPWTDLRDLVTDPDHAYSILEIKDFLEPLLDQAAPTPPVSPAAMDAQPAAPPGALRRRAS